MDYNKNWIGNFYTIENVIHRPYPRTMENHVMYKCNLFLVPNKMTYIKKVYTFTDFMSDVGGFTKTVLASTSFLLAPITTFLFYMNVIQNIYLKTDSESVCQNTE